MKFAYVLHETQDTTSFTKRCGFEHRVVYFGASFYEGDTSSNWVRPSKTNSITGTPHLVRSGLVHPDVLIVGHELFVSENLKNLSMLPGIDLIPVVLEHVVNLEMPSIGHDAIEIPMGNKAIRKHLYNLPHREDLKQKLPSYFKVLMPIYSECRDDFRDGEKWEVYFGGFRGRKAAGPVVYSSTLLKEFSIYDAGAGHFVCSEPVFEILAPVLNLDFHSFFGRRPKPLFRVDETEGVVPNQ